MYTCAQSLGNKNADERDVGPVSGVGYPGAERMGFEPTEPFGSPDYEFWCLKSTQPPLVLAEHFQHWK